MLAGAGALFCIQMAGIFLILCWCKAREDDDYQKFEEYKNALNILSANSHYFFDHNCYFVIRDVLREAGMPYEDEEE
jgi:hypothetical protein